MNDVELHAHLIGQQGGRANLNTPVLVLDGDALAKNIARMAAFARANKLALRPHAKTHKSADIARLQIEAGAVGVCCAKIGEAEALADGGVDAILITSPIIAGHALERVAALHGRMRDLRIVVDHPDGAAALARAIAADTRPLNVLIDIDPGLRRTGVASAKDAVALARAIQADPKLSYQGVQFYCGREQHIASFEERRTAIVKRFDTLRVALMALSEAGAPALVVTGGGTGTHAIDAALGVLTELQAGSYIFMDRQYLDCALHEDTASPFDTALFVETRVISANHVGLATLDAGFKAMATDGGLPRIVAGAPEGAEFLFMGDEHGAVRAKDVQFRLGDVVTLTTPHCDPTVNLYDYYHVVRGDTLVAILPVGARGRSR